MYKIIWLSTILLTSCGVVSTSLEDIWNTSADGHRNIQGNPRIIYLGSEPREYDLSLSDYYSVYFNESIKDENISSYITVKTDGKAVEFSTSFESLYIKSSSEDLEIKNSALKLSFKNISYGAKDLEIWISPELQDYTGEKLSTQYYKKLTLKNHSNTIKISDVFFDNTGDTPILQVSVNNTSSGNTPKFTLEATCKEGDKNTYFLGHSSEIKPNTTVSLKLYYSSGASGISNVQNCSYYARTPNSDVKIIISSN